MNPERPLRAAMVMVPLLGHVTHAANLRAALEQEASVKLSWITDRKSVV